MKRSLLLGAVSAIAMIGSAQAADLGGMKETEATPPLWNWAGFYAGVNGGYIWNTGGVSILDSETGYCGECAPVTYSARQQQELDGGFGGGQIGFNWQRDRLVFGFEGDVQGASLDASRTVWPDPWGYGYGRSEGQLDWFATIRGRAGLVPWQNILVYVTGGVAFGGVQDNLRQDYGYGYYNISNNHSDTFTGYVLGAGVEYGLTPAWSVKFEYQFMDLGTVTLKQNAWDPSGVAVSSELDSKLSFNTVRVGINYHFIPEYVPLK